MTTAQHVAYQVANRTPARGKMQRFPYRITVKTHQIPVQSFEGGARTRRSLQALKQELGLVALYDLFDKTCRSGMVPYGT
jgi:hypothetical protein